MDGFNPEQQMNLGFDPETFFGNHIPEGTTTLSGPEYFRIFKLGMDAGFKHGELQEYLKTRGITILGNDVPDEPHTIEYKTFGTGNDSPQPRRK